MATEVDIDPAAPASGDGAGDDAGDVSWAETATDSRATAKKKALNAVIDAIGN